MSLNIKTNVATLQNQMAFSGKVSVAEQKELARKALNEYWKAEKSIYINREIPLPNFVQNLKKGFMNAVENFKTLLRFNA